MKTILLSMLILASMNSFDTKFKEADKAFETTKTSIEFKTELKSKIDTVITIHEEMNYNIKLKRF